MCEMRLRTIPLHEAALFLDLDGTLAPIVERPHYVGPDRRRNALLKRVQDCLSGRVAVISGRVVDDVDRILAGAIKCVAGVYGLQRREADGKILMTAPHPLLGRVYDVMDDFTKSRPDLVLEFKLLSVALHYRQSPQSAHEVLTLARRLAWATGLRLQQGRMVVELRSVGSDKGMTVGSYMARPPFDGATPIFIGDDMTDEDGFAAATEAGGIGVLVGDRRDTHAHVNLASVDDVLAWLSESLARGYFDFA